MIARLSAVVAASLAEFARCRPSAATRSARPAVLSEVSEWAVDEVAPTSSITARAAGTQLADALTLVERLPATHALMAEGALSPAHARQMVHVVGPVRDDAVRADIEAHVLRLLGRKTPPQLGDCAWCVVLRKDADAAARKLVAAVRERGVRLHDRRDGTATIAIDLPLPVAAAIHRALERYAEAARVDGDERTEQQRMADCVEGLVLRPGEDGAPAVTLALTLVASLETMLGGAEPGQVEGLLVSAEVVRELGYAFGLVPRRRRTSRTCPTRSPCQSRTPGPRRAPRIRKSRPCPSREPVARRRPTPWPPMPCTTGPMTLADLSRRPSRSARSVSGRPSPGRGTRQRPGRRWPVRRGRFSTGRGATVSTAPCWTWVRWWGSTTSTGPGWRTVHASRSWTSCGAASSR
ncbi:DUF222 domain-containing protein [Blastococcus sp. SYSU D01042]